MQAVILAGGKGTRLRPLTYTLPKPMIMVLNKPAIHHIILSLINAGYDEIIITTNYMAKLIEEFFRNQSYKASVICVSEDIPLGTAGSVKNIERYIKGTFAVVQGDSISDINLRRHYEFHKEKGGVVSIAVIPVENTEEYGIVQLDENEKVKRFQEKPKPEESFSNLANTGFYVFEKEVLDYIPTGKHHDFSLELFPYLLKEGKEMYGYKTESYWIDIGRINNYLAGNFWMLRNQTGFSPGNNVNIRDNVTLIPPYTIGDDVTIGDNAVIGPDVIIGDKNIIARGVKIHGTLIFKNNYIGEESWLEECVVADDNEVGSNVKVEKMSIIGKGCRIGDNVRIMNNSKIGPYFEIEANRVVEGVISYNPEKISQLYMVLASDPFFSGLSAEELKVVTILAELGELPAKGISNQTKIPYSKIHDSLFSLQRKGIVVSYGDVPKLFALRYEDKEVLKTSLYRRLKKNGV